MKNTDILLIYPQLGSWDDVVRDIPLSLVYAATHSVKNGFNVKIVDLRLHPGSWQNLIDEILEKGCNLVGISVMTGNPINTSLDISRYIKEKFSIPIVWGGPHPTILPEQTLENSNIDFVIRDWGSKALCELIVHLTGGTSPIEGIEGLGYKKNDRIYLNPPQTCFEILDFNDLPYQLIDITGSNYNRLRSGELIFPIYTSMGCPYKCNFCMSPAVYKKIAGKKWLAFDSRYVLDHMEYLANKYEFHRFQVYDDESFVDLDRMHNLLSGYIAKGYHQKYKLDFRGARINEIDKMDDDYLRLLEKAGVELVFIGMESGSPRVLRLMNKGITVEQIIRVNRKLARYPSIKPHYNFFCGIPGETVDDLILTKNLLLTLVKDHPGCYLGRGGHWKPIPGSVLTEVAVNNYDFKLPSSLEGWATIDSRDAKPLVHPWYTPKSRKMIDLLTVTGIVLDSKAENLTGKLGRISGKFFYYLGLLYRPVLRFRLKYNFTGLFFEPLILRIFTRNIGKLLNKKASGKGYRRK
jgi:radical SAM superfamily enzyme YgiQ (UPF0313 family)